MQGQRKAVVKGSNRGIQDLGNVGKRLRVEATLAVGTKIWTSCLVNLSVYVAVKMISPQQRQAGTFLPDSHPNR